MKDYLRDLNKTEKVLKIINYNKTNDSPLASVVIVTYNTNKSRLEQCLNSLNNQTFEKFETLIVDNNDKLDISNTISKYNAKYIKLKCNYGVTLARNIGINISKGNIIIFLDDDAIPSHNFVEEHLRAYKKYNVLGIRGKSVPKTSAIYNYLASYYDLGDQTMPWPIDLEGNSSFKKEILIKVGGFNPELWGHEGIELSYRIISQCKDKNKLVYYPKAIIYHDYSDTFVKYVKKRLRYDKYEDTLEYHFPDLLKFEREYELSPTKLKKDTPSLFIRIKLITILKFTSFILKVMRLRSTSGKEYGQWFEIKN